MKYFDTATDSAERKYVMTSLGSAKSPVLKLRPLEWTSSGTVKLQDFFYAMGSVGSTSKEGREISWTFFQNIVSEQFRQDLRHDWKRQCVLDGCLHCLVFWRLLFR